VNPIYYETFEILVEKGKMHSKGVGELHDGACVLACGAQEWRALLEHKKDEESSKDQQSIVIKEY